MNNPILATLIGNILIGLLALTWFFLIQSTLEEEPKQIECTIEFPQLKHKEI